MKRLALIVAVALAVVACGGSDNEDASTGSSSSSASASTSDETTTTESEETTEEATTTTTEPEVLPLPANSSPFVVAEGIVDFPPGAPGELSVVAQAAALDRSGSLPVIVRNMTDEALIDISVTGTARDAGGGLVASGEDQGLQPTVVEPGAIAFGYVYFGFDVQGASSFELSVDGTELDDAFFGPGDLAIVEYNRTGDAIIGILRNDSEEEVTGPIGVDLLCLDEAGTPVETTRTYAEPDTAAPGATVSFSFDFFGDPPCERFLLAGSGYQF
jgi:hypothetical protein